MKGTTHLAIGAAIGVAATAYYPFSLKSAALYVTIASFSALSADLDGPSILSSKLGKISKLLREFILWIGVLLSAGVTILYVVYGQAYPEFTTIALLVCLLGFVTKEGNIRNVLVSLIGCAMIYAGLATMLTWLIGFGIFIAIAPWMKHRGMTHTVWALLFWGAIGWGLEQHLQVEGIAFVATAGYFSHLLADSLTPRGVKWFYPISKKKVRIPLSR
ncbi:metal-dependent hydrolase [Paenibacillus sp. 481]|uniref:metal-dependent hydrolase n=1 Tax=Paenibacillus sp. 481 TaxID=2835869 RepID=UPI001E4C7EEE|nr:metal-dependent hydrolase [Paenibacillus sp. 481]UHA73133.1 metal-dependent hydrolase [Paenibacillus sp. 481]